MSGQGLQELVVTISTVHPGPGGGSVFTGQDVTGRWIRAKANYDRMPLAPVKGQVWDLTGRSVFDKVYGPQFHVESCKQIEPTGKLLYSYLRHHPAFRGIGFGDGKIAKLYHRFGDRLREILERGDAVSLAEVLTEAVAERLVAAWRANARESSVITFLSEHGVDTRLAGKIIRYWKADAVEKLRENPYRLLILTSWDATDRLAQRLKVEPSDRRRLVAATEAWLYHRLDRHKDTLSDEQNLKRGVRTLLGRHGEGREQEAIDFALTDGAITGDASSGYQPVGCVVMERLIAQRFEGMVYGISNRVSSSLLDSQLKAFEQQEGMRLNEEQCSAVLMAVTQPLSVLKGGAGVGKTTVLKAIHQVVRETNGTVFQMALAGRAAQRMREATGQEAFTIVGFLNRIKHEKISPRPGDLVIIDESSMLDLLLTYRLVKVLPQGVRLLFVGDPYQLPPIGPGLIFHALANSPVVSATELVNVHRQAESTGIPKIALQVRRGEAPDLADYEGLRCGVSFIECHQRSLVQRLVEVVNDLGGFHETQILGVIKSGPAGVGNINTVFHQLMSPAKPCLRGWNLAEGDPVIYTTNDYERELFNGSLGYVEKVFPDGPDASRRAAANFDGRTLDLSEEDLSNTELGYAITVHKAQGSQFKRVIIPVTKSRILDRTLIYTALTRGVEQVIFVGDKGEFCAAVKKPPSANMRRVGFSIRPAA